MPQYFDILKRNPLWIKKKKKNSTKKASKETNKKHQKAVIIWAAKCLVLYLLNLASGNYRVPVSKSYNWPW